MPEGDSLFRYAASLHAAIAGHAITAARAQGPGRVPRADLLVGTTCTGAHAHGKNLVVEFDNGLALRVHLRMYGAIAIYAPGERWGRAPSQARLVLETATAVAVVFSAPVVELLEQRVAAHHRPLATLGTDLLDDEFDADAAFAAFRDPALAGLTIGDAIMEQRAMAGAGNIWKHEVLFRCRLNPWTKVGDIDDAALRDMITVARETLLAAVGAGGRRSVRRYVYSRGGRPCLRCGTRLRSARQGRDIRFTAWCPKCQPGPGPSAGGEMSGHDR